MSTRPEASDLAVDELKRRARRRLVGAIVLALMAAVLLPLLLESEPKPLGDDVSIQIPPTDSGKFVNPLSPEKAPPGKSDESAEKMKTQAPAEAAAPAPPAAPPASEAKPAAPGPKSTAAPPAASSKPEASTTAKTEAKEAPPEAEAKPEVAPEPGTAVTPAASAPEIKAEPLPATPKSQAKLPTKDANTSGNGFVIQVAAFTDRYGALALVRKLKQAGFPGYTEAVTTDKGSLHRVRVGPYPSREAAEAARVKLKAAGYEALVARAQ